MDLLHRKGIRFTRWILFIVLIVGILTGLGFGLWETCTESVVEGKVHQLCSSPGVGEPRVILLILLAVLLVLPDMNEVGIFGILLKRRVEEAERQVSELRHEIKMAVASQSVATSQLSVENFLVTPDLIGSSKKALTDNAPKFLAGEEVEHARAGSASPNLNLVWEIISNWEELTEALGLGMHRRAFSEGAESQYKKYVMRFRSDFAEQIGIVQSTRNSVAHARYVPEKVLEEAASLSRELLKLNRAGLLKFNESRRQV